MSDEHLAMTVSPRGTRHLDIAWIVLVVSTGIGWWLGRSAQGASLEPIAVCGVILTAFFKAWIVGFEFMELRGAPRWLRHGYDAWVLGVCAVLLWILLA